MAKKQAITTKTAPGAASAPQKASAAATARVAKPRSPRAASAKHSKSVTKVEDTSVSEFGAVTAAGPVVESGAVSGIPAVSAVALAPETVTPSASPREAISKLAYGYWAARGFQGGSSLEDWLRAEREYYAAR